MDGRCIKSCRKISCQKMFSRAVSSLLQCIKKKDLMSALTLKAIPLYQCLKEILKKVQKLLVGLEHKELQNQIG